MNCANCRFWYRKLDDDGHATANGECRLHPPVHSGGWKIPETDQSYWCGDYKPHSYRFDWELEEEKRAEEDRKGIIAKLQATERELT